MNEINRKNEKWKESNRKITAKELLFSLVEAPINVLLSFDGKNPFSLSHTDNRFDCEDVAQKLYYLKRRKLIKSIIKNNKKFYEITKKGREAIAWEKIDEASKRQAGKWDGYLRIVMFDIPENKKSTREVIRKKLKNIGFVQEQKSVFVYPFVCKEEIDAIAYFCSSKKYIKYMVVQIIEGQEDLMQRFVDNGVLSLADLKSAHMS